MEGQSNGKRRITIREAATLLGVHPNTVRSRIKDGSIEAEKVVTERGPTWMIDPDSLTTNTPTSDSQQLVGRVPQEALTLLAREIVREAGIAREPEVDHAREGLKLIFEAAKTQALLTSGVIVAGVTVGSLLPNPSYLALLYVALLLAAFSLSSTLFHMNFLAAIVGLEAEDLQKAPWSRPWTIRVLLWSSLGMFALSLVLLAGFIAANMP